MVDWVGLIPAAGSARRLGKRVGSKEILPVGPPGGSTRPACHWLLDGLAAGGVERVLMVLRSGKWDVPECLGDGRAWGLDLAYRVIEPTPAVPYTLAAGLAFCREQGVVLGFPDILFRPRSAVAELLTFQAERGSDVALALVPSDRPDKADMVEIDTEGGILGFRIKETGHDLRLTWMLAAWTPAFSHYLQSTLERLGPEPPEDALRAGELQLSSIFAAAKRDGLRVDGHEIPDATYLDIGTPDDLERARTDASFWLQSEDDGGR